MEIRKATEKDVNRISYLVRKSTDKNPNNYSKEQIKAWKKYNTPSKIKDQLNQRIVFCAFEKNKLIGTIALKDDYILGFYVCYTQIKKGIGTKLLTFIETYALKKNVKKLYLTSTPSALSFYKKNDYILTKNVISSILGIDYSEIEMEKNMIK